MGYLQYSQDRTAVTTVNKINPVHLLIFSTFTVHFDIILPSTQMSAVHIFCIHQIWKTNGKAMRQDISYL
jgi:hypothetical protein